MVCSRNIHRRRHDELTSRVPFPQARACAVFFELAKLGPIQQEID